MAAGAIRGSRVGAGPMGESGRAENAARRAVSFFCERGHETVIHFALDAVTPEVWDCTRCGLPSGTDAHNRPVLESVAPFKTHLAYAKERRSENEAKSILNEALTELRSKRKSGEIIF